MTRKSNNGLLTWLNTSKKKPKRAVDPRQKIADQGLLKRFVDAVIDGNRKAAEADGCGKLYDNVKSRLYAFGAVTSVRSVSSALSKAPVPNPILTKRVKANTIRDNYIRPSGTRNWLASRESQPFQNVLDEIDSPDGNIVRQVKRCIAALHS